ncbi:reverse transcriptase [Fusarium bulbicola]|nr:reverse transcriptase [Fusarium bulbicola]
MTSHAKSCDLARARHPLIDEKWLRPSRCSYPNLVVGAFRPLLNKAGPTLSVVTDVTRFSTSTPQADARTATLTVPPIPTDTLYCTIDVSRIEGDEARPSAGTIRATVENEARAELDNPALRCEAGQNWLEPRVLRDDLYPIKVDNVSRTAVLNEMNEIRIEAAETLGRENDTEVASCMAQQARRPQGIRLDGRIPQEAFGS